jgi:stage VI sporulation protein D
MKGGTTLSQENESSLRFTLEESIWFQKGQEVAELISISLDPQITILENEQYVTIEGVLQLTGEYKRHEAEPIEEEPPFSPKFIQQVEERGEGVLEFAHRFPVDITIPNNRIQNIYDIDVEIESFDYLFPERSCMKLTADLTISGLYGEQQHAPAEEKEQESEVELLYRESAPSDVAEASPNREETAQKVEVSPLPENIYEPFEVEARKAPEPVSKVELFKEPNRETHSEETANVENESVDDHYPEISLLSVRKEESPAYVEQEQVTQQTAELAEEESPSPEESESSSSEPVIKKKKSKKSKKQGISLTEFFARKQEEEDVARLKVCIVQSGETIDMLAERYDVSVQSLLKVNQLEVNQDVHEGQVLYIPVAIVQN